MGEWVARWCAVLALMVAAACGGAGDSGEPPVNADDVMFVQMMVQHHRQGIEMARIGADRATDEELKALTAAIASTQQSEVEMMLRWLHAWGQPVTPPDGAHDHHGGLPETDRQKIEGLRKADPFEPELLTLLMAHQEGAVQLAATEIKDGVNPDATGFAARVQSSRKEQIEMMRRILERVSS